MGNKDQDITKLIDELSPTDTINFMKWLIAGSEKKELTEKSKPQKSTSTEDVAMRRLLGM